MKWEEKILEIENLKLKYYIKGNGIPILFFHGGAVNAKTYFKSLELLSEKYLIIVPDIPCFGGSSVPRLTWDFEDYAEYFSKFVDTLSFEDIVLVGHSFGGGIALNLAQKNERISKLVLIDSAGISPAYSLLKLFFLLIKKSISGFSENKKITLLILSDFMGEIFRNFFSLPKIFRIVKKSIFGTCAFTEIKKPTSIFWGIRDELFDKKFAQEMHRCIKDSELKFVEGSHDWCLLQPDKFSELILKILR